MLNAQRQRLLQHIADGHNARNVEIIASEGHTAIAFATRDVRADTLILLEEHTAQCFHLMSVHAIPPGHTLTAAEIDALVLHFGPTSDDSAERPRFVPTEPDHANDAP